MALGNQGPNAPSMLTPPAREPLTKLAVLAAGESTTFAAFGIPKGSFISGVYTISLGANTTQTVSAGFSAAGTELVSTFAPNSTGYAAAGAASGTAVGTLTTADNLVYFFASAALTSTVYLKVEYYLPPSGQPF